VCKNESRTFFRALPTDGGSVARPSCGRRSTSRTTSPRTAPCSPSRGERNGPTFIVRRARLPSAPLLSLLAFLAHRSSHHVMSSPAVPSLDARTTPSPWHAHHVAPSHVHHRARTARHSKPSQSSICGRPQQFLPRTGPASAPSLPLQHGRHQLRYARMSKAADSNYSSPAPPAKLIFSGRRTSP
jgi:hypothetical protein